MSEQIFARVSEFVTAKMGLCFPPDRLRDLERGLASAAAELGCGSAEECADLLLSSNLSRREIEILASHLTVGETYFLREKPTLDVFSSQVLPELIMARRAEQRLRIWSAGCCTGEEPYSIAILLTRTLPDWRNWNLTILGTDINPRFLQKAAEGRYTDWSFRSTPEWVKQECFQPVGKGTWEILPHLRQMVQFGYLNLAEDVYPSLLNNTNAMDIIFCRNVLMYFSREQAARVIDHFHSSLVGGGWLFVSPTETSPVLYKPFVAVNYSGVTAYQKAGPKAALQEKPRIATDRPASPVSVPDLKKAEAPSDSEYRRALTLHEAGRHAEAREKLRGILDSDRNNSDAAALLARVNANQGNLVEALQWCDRAIHANKLNPELHYLRASILQEQGNFENSATTFKRALYLDPTFVLAHFALGNLALHHGNAEEADRHFANALSHLDRQPPDRVLPGSEGVTSGRLVEIIRATLQQERTR